ncbi:hypothetical protein F511_21619 [Dorcoceras hygrometricum]|uniref:Uncharacterized protein n=1 Tax=Dorcoceras hygrometricum TaxID=472368 RepID=A0A2Z7D187_9LAMI|nr:hypothetical protein F511_21619 [Dorcoceras hygrometricum]
MMRRRFVVATGSPAASEFRRYFLLLLFVPYLSNPRALFSRELFRRFPVVSVVVLARARLLPESSGFLAGLVVAQYKMTQRSTLLFNILIASLSSRLPNYLPNGSTSTSPNGSTSTSPRRHLPKLRGTSGNQAGQSGSSAGRSPRP